MGLKPQAHQTQRKLKIYFPLRSPANYYVNALSRRIIFL